MTTLITTIGNTEYTETTYCFSDQSCYRTCYVAEAIACIKNVDQVVFLMTEQACAKHWEKLQERFHSLEPVISITKRDIPDGKNETETWQIFDALVDTVPANSQVIFDITHAFRSIPLFVLLAALLLRKAKQVEIQGLYYGMYQKNEIETPIIDLTPAVRLIDWLTATDKFISTGSAVELGGLLRTVHQDFYRSQKLIKDVHKPTKLQNFGRVIQDVSRSIELIRPVHLLREDLPKLIKHSTPELEQEIGVFSKPFGLMLEQVRQSYIPLALSHANASAMEQIYKQFLLLQWYVEKQFTIHALLMAREWVVSALCLLDGREDYRKREHREQIENQLNAIRFGKDHPGSNLTITAHITDVKTLVDFWSRLGDYRNDIAHVQMNESPLDSQALERFALNELIPTLQSLFPSLTQLPELEVVNSNRC